jgi:hypothetical protein
MGTVKVSLNYTLPIPLHYSTHKVFNSQVNYSSNMNFPRLSPTENCSVKVKVKVKVPLRLTVGQSVSLAVEPPSGAHDQIFITV